ncbi:hypothetical protein [Vibrio nigripulchritudo]|uniref:hypothetical protein n=1 Tax=Vibrio nigripulchritudo TaxID=28173 RepID=UPI00190D89A1|nr:hypothetical protein [Vibrio nigripulchritudo]
MIEALLQSVVIPALVSIIGTGITLYLKVKFDSKSHKNKVAIEHEHTEKKKIKEAIASHKVKTLNSFEEMNHRLWNLAKNHNEEWHVMNSVYHQEDKYYFHSFVYRLAAVSCLANKAETDLIYLDTTLADKSELDFLKFCKFVNVFLCQTSLYEGLEYDESEPVDHFYRHRLLKEVNGLLSSNGEIIPYEEFEADLFKHLSAMKGLCQFIDAISPIEQRHRWTKLFSLQLVLICFLNTYGYDFQHTSDKQIDEVLNFLKLHGSGEVALVNFTKSLKKHKLDTNIEISKIIEKIST